MIINFPINIRKLTNKRNVKFLFEENQIIYSSDLASFIRMIVKEELNKDKVK